MKRDRFMRPVLNPVALFRHWFSLESHPVSFWRDQILIGITLNIVLGSSTEPFLLIRDPLQSPFNVGAVINMERDFTVSETQSLNEAFNDCFNTDDQRRLMSLVNGQPYLTHKAMFDVSIDKFTPVEVFTKALDEDGPFGEHLRHMKRRLENAGLKQALLDGWDGKKIDKETQHRLIRSGYGRMADDGSLVPRCQLYYDYLTT